MKYMIVKKDAILSQDLNGPPYVAEALTKIYEVVKCGNESFSDWSHVKDFEDLEAAKNHVELLRKISPLGEIVYGPVGD